jgi:hypothetical protein
MTSGEGALHCGQGSVVAGRKALQYGHNICFVPYSLGSRKPRGTQRAGEQDYLTSHSNTAILPGQVFKHAIRQNGYVLFLFPCIKVYLILCRSGAKEQP